MTLADRIARLEAQMAVILDQLNHLNATAAALVITSHDAAIRAEQTRRLLKLGLAVVGALVAAAPAVIAISGVLR